MSASAGSNEARAKWISLIHDCLSRLRAVHQSENTISSELQFRDQFYRLPRDLNGPSAERNYSRFNRSHGQMLSIVTGLDKALQLESPESLNDVFWTHALAALQAAMNRELSYSEISEMYPKLNNRDAIPKISSDLPQFPRSVRVQEPLQHIFDTYIDCYYGLINHYTQADNLDDTGSLIDTIDNSTARYAHAESEWRDRIKEQKNEQLTYAVQNLRVKDSQHRDDRFEHIRELGRGTYGFVDEVREVTTGSVYARKSIPVRIVGQDSMSIQQRVENEVSIMSEKLRHNHIASVNIYFRNDDYWSMIMLPVADYDLRTFLDEKCVGEGFPQDALRMLDPWFGCLISALAYAHSERVKHEDIKPNNILIKDKKVYLTDFGTAKDFSALEASTVSDYSITGTPVYWAPEPRIWGRPADIFALGCVFSEMLTVRQKRSLQDYRNFRHNSSQEFAYAYRSSLIKVRRWLKDLDGIDRRDPAAQTILEQTFNMLVENSHDRLEASRLKRNFRTEESLFCDTCF